MASQMIHDKQYKNDILSQEQFKKLQAQNEKWISNHPKNSLKTKIQKAEKQEQQKQRIENEKETRRIREQKEIQERLAQEENNVAAK